MNLFGQQQHPLLLCRAKCRFRLIIAIIIKRVHYCFKSHPGKRGFMAGNSVGREFYCVVVRCECIRLLLVFGLNRTNLFELHSVLELILFAHLFILHIYNLFFFHFVLFCTCASTSMAINAIFDVTL